ncbi:MAG: penicillin-binding protein 2, partial [candidate division Zixibacteria bacterium]|nr:penicillin-binding protein 2 [candidate division Zixibacteria bacterium]
MKRKRQNEPIVRRIWILQAFLIVFLAVIVGRLFYIQVMSHSFYSALANDQHDIFRELFPERGEIYLSDPKAPDGRFPAAVNKTLATVYADTRQLTDGDKETIAKALALILEMEEDALLGKLTALNDPYVPLKSKLDDLTVLQMRDLELSGIDFSQQPFRFYPEKEATCHLTGFVGSNEQGERIGRYGIEGHWEKELAGEQGFLQSERDPTGQLITAGSHNFRPALDGADILLTVDRNIQFVACNKLKDAVKRYNATGGAVVVIEPNSGRLLAICGNPDFDPNNYSQEPNMSAFNNPATYYAYEPGSVFKPFTMASAIDAEKVSPKTIYHDEGKVEIGIHTINNSDGKAYGFQTMTQVLEKSLNTGAIFAVRELGADRFREYIEAFGFGQAPGVALDVESKGNISSLHKRGDIWSATASYGQGITATPIQVASAFAVLANSGKLMKPYVVEEVRYQDGTGQRIEPQSVRQVVSKRAADLVSGMLVRVVENGHGKR